MRPRRSSLNGSAENSRGIQTLGWILLFSLCGSLYTIYRFLEPRSVESIINSQAYVTLVLSEKDVVGARVLGQSLLDTKTKRKLVALVVEDSISLESREELKMVGFNLHWVPREETGGNHSIDATIALVWTLSFEKIVFLSPDILVRHNVDSLFDFPAFSAVGDCCGFFDGGVWVAAPSRRTLAQLLERAHHLQIHVTAEELLNRQFLQWTPLPFFYNAQMSHLSSLSLSSWSSLVQRQDFHIVRFDNVHPWAVGAHWAQAREEELAQEWWRVHERLPISVS